MERRIENGTTILSTGKSTIERQNKHGHTGINYSKRNGKYRAEINYKRKKYHLGYHEEIEPLIAIRKEAEKHVKDGTFLEWYHNERRSYNGLKKRN